VIKETVLYSWLVCQVLAFAASLAMLVSAVHTSPKMEIVEEWCYLLLLVI